MAIDPKEKHKQAYKSLLNINALRKRILPIFVFLGILVPSSTVFAATASIVNNTSGNVNSGTCVDRTFSMVSTGTIDDVTIQVDIDHNSRDELDISLTSPLGTSVVLSNDNGGTANNLNALFDDTVATSIVGDNTNHTSTVQRRPQVALNTFDGENAIGTWTLTSCDDTSLLASTGRGTFNKATLNITYTSTPPPPIESGLSVNFQMDECYWLGGANGVLDDVKDSSLNAYHATSSAAAIIITNNGNPPLCNYGSFSAQPDLISTEDVNAGNTSGGFTVSVWLKPSAMTNWQAIITKSKAYDWNDGWGLVHYKDDPNNKIRFFVNNYYYNNVQTTLTLDTWNHVVATYDNNTLRIYVNGTVIAKDYIATVTNSVEPLRIAYDDPRDDEYIGAVDELKFWDRVLNEDDVRTLYTNESAGTNYDGTARTCPTCSASIAAGTWELIGIPADLRAGSYSVADVLSADMSGVYGNDWRIYRRDYSDTNNSSWDTYLSETDVMEFGKGYWLGSKNNENWDVNDIVSVDYDSSNGACTANHCVEVDLKSISLDLDSGDDLVGTGAHRYNMTGFVGKTAVNWADCRIIIDGITYTPSAAYDAGYVEKQIWKYNPGDGGADSNGYTTCDDITPGGCKLEPHKGFWIKLHGSTKNKTVKLLIPQE